MSEQVDTWVRRMGPKIGLLIAAIAVLYLVLGFVLVPILLRDHMIALVADKTGIEPTIADVDFDPLAMRLTVEGFELAESEGGPSLVAFDSLAAEVRLLGMWSADVALSEVVLVAPRISAEIDESGRLNLLQLLAAASSEGAPEEPDPNEDEPQADGSRPRSLVAEVDSIQVVGGEISFRDRSRHPVFEARVRPIDLDLAKLSTRAGHPADGSLSIQVGDRTRLHWNGSLDLEPISSSGVIGIEDFDLSLPVRYFADRLGADVTSGSLDVEAHYDFDLGSSLDAGPVLSIDGAQLEIRDLAVNERATGDPAVVLPHVTSGPIVARLDGSGLRLLQIEEVASQGGRLVGRLDESGELSWLAMARGESPPEGESTEGPSEGPEPSGDQVGSAPEVRVDRIRLEGFAIDLEDRSQGSPVAHHWDPLDLRVDDLQLPGETPMQLSFETGVGAKGHLSITGPLRIEPLDGRLAIQLDSLALADFGPYVQRFADLEIASGSLSSKIELSLNDGAEREVGFGVTGRAQVDDLALKGAAASEELFSSKRLRAEGIDFASRPEAGRLAIKKIAIEGTGARYTIASDGRSNFDSVLRGSDDRAEEGGASSSDQKTAAGTDRLAVRIDRIRFTEVSGLFVDRTRDPAVVTGIEALSGTIDGLTTSPGASAQVNLEGRFRDGGPIEIEGEIDPLSPDPSMHLELEGSGLGLTSFSGYSEQFVGYRIENGRLGVDLVYTLEGRKLVAQNQIHLGRFRFGEKVASEDATNLPVTLAAAVMRDSKGDIDLDLPIRGDLDDPGFSVMSLLGKSFVQVITNAATSSFAVVGGLVGESGEDLAQVVFDPGSARVSASEGVVIDGLADALVTRPELRLDIRGRAAEDVDGPVLQAALLDAELKALAFGDLPEAERKRVGSPDRLDLGKEQRRAVLARLYRERVGADGAGLLDSSSDDDADGESRTERRETAMAQAMIAQIEIDQGAYRDLAEARARAVKQAFLDAADLDAERVKLLDADVSPVAGADRVAADLSLTAEAD